MLQTWARTVTDLIAPPRCLGCLEEGKWWCQRCAASSYPPQYHCIHCGNPAPRGLTCRTCRQNTVITGLITAGSYTNAALRRGIHWLKFKGVRAVAPILADFIVSHLTTIASSPTLRQTAKLVPIPLHPRRLRTRGFNQSLDIAYTLSERMGISIAQNMVVRQRSTWTQTALPPTLRHNNMADAFCIHTPPDPSVHYWLLLDDVTTSGATLSAAAQTIADYYEKFLTEHPRPQIWGCAIAQG